MQIYGLNDRGHPVKLLQRALNEKLKRNLVCDGHLGRVTQAAILQYQEQQGIDEEDADGACYGEKTQSSIGPFIEKRYLQENDFEKAAKELGVDIASVKAITQVEAKEFGFLPNGFPVVLFERHKFYQMLAKHRGAGLAAAMVNINPGVCNPQAGGYVGGAEEVKRLDTARTIDETCAYLSASYGLFQIMGFNYEACGFANVHAFVDAMKRSEDDQLMAFVNFMKADKKLHSAVKDKDWTEVARRYNGPAYAKNQYDVKLAAAYSSFKG
ncbi:MAG: N-acetylmuramidase family protein [Rhodoferax sp.]|uniref:N-acetylmuramidase family protein n=1 Tax=Rhodoferax sp. TaxID=50421 RepID=UPI002620BBC6|nr:N-acetylmuramidase family protein [Rhodoferax sp.]MDD2879652.1 N-acetylmuramidase family protein [Rhodoferax sp.]